MSGVRIGAFALLAFAATSFGEDFLDRVDEALTISAFGDQVRARLSGTVDLEAYAFDSAYAPGLLFTDRKFLLNPRLTLFLDAQLGSRVYFFAQARVDRGFDPTDRGAEVRLDEYALRFTPWDDGRFSLQIGKFATIIGNWATRHGSWENPFITAPLPYENLTGIWDSAPPHSARELFSWAHVRDGFGGFFGDENSDKNLRQPIVWGPAYTTGLAVFGRIGKFDYAADFKNAAVASRPESWDGTQVQWQHPSFSGRLGFRPDQKWKFGISASLGSYLLPDAARVVEKGRTLDDYQQIVLGQDISFAWHQWQIWGEVYQNRFRIPGIGNADTLSYFLEAKYKFSPQLFGALRWNQQLYSHIEGRRWGRELWRADAALGYRITPHTQFKVQYTFQQESEPRRDSHLVAAQFTLRF